MQKTDLVKKGLNSNQLKIIAIIAMTIDHITHILLLNKINNNVFLALRVIGKITIPIMWFFISEGYYHTKNLKKYVGRLFIFSIISHFAYCYAFNKSIVPTNIFFETSVIWSLTCGLISLWIAKNDKINIWIKMLVIFLIACSVYNADWGFISVLAIVFLGLTRGKRKTQMLGMAIIVVIYEIAKFNESRNYYQFMHFGIFLAIPLLMMYNGQRGKQKWLKWFFYWYYPFHLVLLGIIKALLIG